MKDYSTNDGPACGASNEGGDEVSPPWAVILLKEPEKIVRRLPRDLREDIDRCLKELAHNPRPGDCSMRKGSRLYRVKIRHDWRIIYDVDDERKAVVIAEIGPRGSIYRDR